MNMNSCLYECDVMHYRMEPVKNRFAYKVFMFYLDLDEIDSIARRFRLISRGVFNLFSFREEDHLHYGGATVRENITQFLASRGVDIGRGRIMLLTHLRMLGYVFNPVSFYFCFNEAGDPVAAVAEVGNTFHEQKGYLLDASCRQGDSFQQRVAKNFYVSPFIDLDAEFDFRLHVPDDNLRVLIDDYKEGRKFFLSSLTGRRTALSDRRLAWYALSFPFLTLKIIFLIHWQALVLRIKGLTYWRKADHPELQEEMQDVRNR